MEVEIDAEISERGLMAVEIEEAIQGGIAGLAALSTDEFAYRIVGQDGTVWYEQGEQADFPLPLPGESAFVTLQYESKPAWRVYNLELTASEGGPAAWLQTAKSLESVNGTLASLRIQLFWGIPLTIVLAALGGFFLADRGLRPIDRITQKS